MGALHISTRSGAKPRAGRSWRLLQPLPGAVLTASTPGQAGYLLKPCVHLRSVLQLPASWQRNSFQRGPAAARGDSACGVSAAHTPGADQPHVRACTQGRRGKRRAAPLCQLARQFLKAVRSRGSSRKGSVRVPHLLPGRLQPGPPGPRAQCAGTPCKPSWLC